MNRFKFKIVMEIRVLFLINSSLPVDFDSDTEGPPSDTSKRCGSVSSDREVYDARIESGVKLKLNTFDSFAERSIARDGPHIHSPPILIILVSLQHFCWVANQQPHHDSFSDHLLLLLNGSRVESCHLSLQLLLGLVMPCLKRPTAERAAEVASDDGGFSQAVLAKNVAAGIDADGFVEDSKTNRAAMVLVNIFSAFLHFLSIYLQT